MKQINELIDKIPNYLKNKYLIAIVLFSVWVTFFDNFNLIKQSKILSPKKIQFWFKHLN